MSHVKVLALSVLGIALLGGGVSRDSAQVAIDIGVAPIAPTATSTMSRMTAPPTATMGPTGLMAASSSERVVVSRPRRLLRPCRQPL